MPDGSILRARLPGRPTQDCLFSDPARDGVRYFQISLTINLVSITKCFILNFLIKLMSFPYLILVECVSEFKLFALFV